MEIVENKRANLQGDRGAHWSLRIVSDCETAGHGGRPVRFEAQGKTNPYTLIS